MSDTHPTNSIPDQPATYEICLQGHLPERWIAWFGEVAIGLEEDGVTRLTYTAIDQAALHGLLKVRDFRLPLVSVNLVKRSQTSPVEESMNMNSLQEKRAALQHCCTPQPMWWGWSWVSP